MSHVVMEEIYVKDTHTGRKSLNIQKEKFDKQEMPILRKNCYVKCDLKLTYDPVFLYY